VTDNAAPWFDMLESRNTTAHVYDEETETNVIDQILTRFYPILKELAAKMERRI